MEENMQQGRAPAFLLYADPYTRRIRFELVMTLLVMVACAVMTIAAPTETHVLAATTQDKTAVSRQASRPTPAEETPQQTPAAGQEQSQAPAPTATPAAARVVQRACIPNGSYSSAPAPLALSGRAPGLSVSHEGPYYYQVFGSNASEVRSQLLTCGPRGDFAGDASYSLNWQYALIRPEGSESCVPTGVKVGLRTQVLLPSRDGSLPLAREWNAFSAGLATHESGHVALSGQYASRLYATLQNYPPGDCYTMGPQVEAAARSVANELKAAQAQYDAATSHGAAQGARW